MIPPYCIAFWHLANPFAPEHFPERIPWLANRMTDELKGWTPELFSRKLDQLTSILNQIHTGKGPDATAFVVDSKRLTLVPDTLIIKGASVS